MTDPLSFVISASAVAVVLAIGALTDKQRRLKRRMRKAPRRSIRHLPDKQLARYSGTVEPIAKPLTAPLTGRTCAYWRVELQEKRGRNSWRTVLERDVGNDFSIRDDTGALLVRVSAARLALEQDGTFWSGMADEPTPELRRFLDENGEDAKGLFFNRSLRYLEAVIEAGERVTVAGIAHAEPDPEPRSVPTGYRESPMRMVLQGTKDQPVLITDDPSEAKKR